MMRSLRVVLLSFCSLVLVLEGTQFRVVAGETTLSGSFVHCFGEMNSGYSRYTRSQDNKELVDTSWQLVKFQGGDDQTLTPDDRAKYTINFKTGGRVSLRVDCNRGSGTWRSAGPNQVEFGQLALTRAMCPPGSLHDHMVKNWQFIKSYVIKDGHLFLSLMADAGIYEFEPMTNGPSMNLSSGLGGKRWRLVELNGAEVKDSKAYIEFDSEAKRFSGDGGCNRIAGGFTADGTRIKFSQGISTQRACLDAEVQRIESELLRALPQASEYKIESNQLRLFSGDKLLLTLSADSSDASSEATSVTGTVTYRERVALTPDAVVEVRLVDVTKAGAAPITIAHQAIKAEGKQVPFQFEIKYDPSRIDTKGRYAIQVHILEKGKIRFANAQSYYVITGGNPKAVNVIVRSAR